MSSDVLRGRVAMVTGGSRGTGFATAQLLTEAGATVVVLAREKTRLDEVVATLGGATLGIPTDIGDPEQLEAAFSLVGERFGRLDLLVNNAAMGKVRLVHEATLDDVERHFAVNLLAPVHTTRLAVPLLRQSDHADIVFVSSEAVGDPMPFLALYSSGKAGLEHFAQCMITELKPLGIRVTLLQSGTTATEFAREWEPADFERAAPVWEAGGWPDRLTGRVPMQPEWVAEVLLFAVTRPRGQMLDVVHARSFS